MKYLSTYGEKIILERITFDIRQLIIWNFSASGILLSNYLIRSVVASLDWCVKNAYSESDDANLGRCIVHATDIACSSKAGTIQYTGHPLLNPDLPYHRILKDSTLLDAISVWPVYKPELIYRLHHYFVKVTNLFQ